MSEIKEKDKFFLPNLKKSLVTNGKSFTSFMDRSALIDKSPSRRAWADAISENKGVTETTAHKMRIRIEQIFENWKIELNGSNYIEKINNKF